MEDTTQPNEINWQVPAMIFARTLSLILDENQGIVVNLEPLTKITDHEDINQVIVYKKDNQVHIAPSEDNFEEGTALNLNITEK